MMNDFELSDLDRESIVQSFDFLNVVSTLCNKRTPTVEEVFENAGEFRSYFSTHTEEMNDFCLSLSKDHLFERINREEVLPSDISVKTLLDLSKQLRNKTENHSKKWNENRVATYN